MPSGYCFADLLIKRCCNFYSIKMVKTVDRAELLSDTADLLTSTCKTFTEQFSEEGTHAAFAPGRVNLIGEHTDYNDGFVFPMALPLITLSVGKLNSLDSIRLYSTAEGVDNPRLVMFPLPTKDKPLTPGSPSWANYVKGVISLYPGEITSGFDMAISTTVPLGGGLSSSASLEVVTFTLLQSLFPSDVSDKDKALVCQQAEHKFADMPCGIMDQFISTMGAKDHALLIDCESMESKLVRLELNNKSILIINSNVKHELTGSEYPTRRKNCADASSMLSVKSLRYANLTQLEDAKNDMDEMVYRRARHVISEIERCTEATRSLENGNITKFGELMVQSHNSLRDDFEVSCAELDSLVEIVVSVEGVYGSRMTGGGFGGCTVTLCDSSAIPQIKQQVNKRYSGMATFIECSASDGARIIQL